MWEWSSAGGFLKAVRKNCVRKTAAYTWEDSGTQKSTLALALIFTFCRHWMNKMCDRQMALNKNNYVFVSCRKTVTKFKWYFDPDCSKTRNTGFPSENYFLTKMALDTCLSLLFQVFNPQCIESELLACDYFYIRFISIYFELFFYLNPMWVLYTLLLQK